MTAYPMVPGVPAAGHISRGYWHPGPIAGCRKCSPPPTPVRDERGRRTERNDEQ